MRNIAEMGKLDIYVIDTLLQRYGGLGWTEMLSESVENAIAVK